MSYHGELNRHASYMFLKFQDLTCRIFKFQDLACRILKFQDSACQILKFQDLVTHGH